MPTETFAERVLYTLSTAADRHVCVRTPAQAVPIHQLTRDSLWTRAARPPAREDGGRARRPVSFRSPCSRAGRGTSPAPAAPTLVAWTGPGATPATCPATVFRSEAAPAKRRRSRRRGSMPCPRNNGRKFGPPSVVAAAAGFIRPEVGPSCKGPERKVSMHEARAPCRGGNGRFAGTRRSRRRPELMNRGRLPGAAC